MKRMVSLAAALALLLLACGEDGVVTPRKPDRLLPGAPVDVLKNTELAFNNYDLNLLKAMLSENFVFYFDPRDVGQNPPRSQYVIPESWTRTEFSRTVTNMFKKAHAISLYVNKGNVGKPEAEATEYNTEKVRTALLVMIDELSGYSGEGPCDFAFEKYTSKEGRKYWRLTKWRDGSGYDGGDDAAG
jgi:hypothetical protein